MALLHVPTMSESKYIQVIPLFTREHGAVSAYFRANRSLLDAMTGPHLMVALSQVLVNGDGREAWDTPDSERYAGLQHGDLPCLWVEDSDHYHFVLGLPSTGEEISKLFAQLTDCAKTARSARELELNMKRTMKIRSKDVDPIWPSPVVRLWGFGSFFVFAFAVIIAGILLLARAMHMSWAILAIASTYSGLLIIGAFVLSYSGTIKEATLLTLVKSAMGLQWKVVEIGRAAIRQGIGSLKKSRSDKGVK